MLEINTEYGYAQVCFENKDLIRMRGKGISFRFFARTEPHEAAIPRLDGTYQLALDEVGEFLFVPIKGRVEFDAEWDWKRMGSEDLRLDIAPDENGEFELAIHFADANTERCENYRPFDECLAEAQADYDAWYDLYPPVPGRYEDIKKLAAYAVWICYISPKGLLTDNIVLFDKRNTSAFSWHQAYHALSITNNVDQAVQIMLAMFKYQDEYGEIPDLYDDKFCNILATKPPFHGFALLKMIENYGYDLTTEHCKAMYDPLARWYNWWLTIRDTDGDGVPQYNQGCESGNDFTPMLAKGVPVECPDLMAYLILLSEGLAVLAGRIGKHDEEIAWNEKSKKMLETLIEEFWDGEKFIARLSSSHEIVEYEESDAFIPIMLGKRLPKEILDTMAEQLLDPEKYYTPKGFRSGPKQYKDGAVLPGFISGFSQIKLIPGLYEAGYEEAARAALIGFCEENLEKLPNFAYLEFDPPGINPSAIFGPCSALSSAIFIVMANYLYQISVKTGKE
ncbi:MAG: hypothetical protein LBQ68_06600 [Clostridiales bacterium]|nr:hypothetical protein [Clostridiales bacterium]